MLNRWWRLHIKMEKAAGRPSGRPPVHYPGQADIIGGLTGIKFLTNQLGGWIEWSVGDKGGGPIFQTLDNIEKVPPFSRIPCKTPLGDKIPIHP